jgi:hypothetical protein
MPTFREGYFAVQLKANAQRSDERTSCLAQKRIDRAEPWALCVVLYADHLFVYRRNLGPSRNKAPVYLKRKLYGIAVRIAPRELYRPRHQVKRGQDVFIINPTTAAAAADSYGSAK